MIETSRRSLITGLVALVAAPAIVKVASLMPVNAALQPGISMRLLASYEPGEAATQLDVLYGSLTIRSEWSEFAAEGAKIGSQLRIRLPSDYTVIDGPSNPYDQISIQMLLDRQRAINDMMGPVPVALGPLALAAAAMTLAPAVLEKPVTRRFWGK